jgi:hypothetical protein
MFARKAKTREFKHYKIVLDISACTVHRMTPPMSYSVHSDGICQMDDFEVIRDKNEELIYLHVAI